MDLEQNLNSESVGLAHPSPPVIVEPDAPVSEVLRILRVEKRGCALVCEDGVLQGIFAEREALTCMVNGQTDVPVSEVMTRPAATLKPQDSIATAIRKLSFSGYRRLPVVDSEQRPVSILKVARVLHYLVEFVSKAVYTLPPQPRPVTQEREGA